MAIVLYHCYLNLVELLCLINDKTGWCSGGITRMRIWSCMSGKMSNCDVSVLSELTN